MFDKLLFGTLTIVITGLIALSTALFVAAVYVANWGNALLAVMSIMLNIGNLWAIVTGYMTHVAAQRTLKNE